MISTGGHGSDAVIITAATTSTDPVDFAGEICRRADPFGIPSMKIDLQMSSDPENGLHVGRLLTADEIILTC